MISIKLTYKDGDTESFVFHKSIITVGRSGENDIKVVSASGVSRHHLKLLVEAGQIVVEDLNSTNGTLLNSIKVNRAIVGANDIIEVGDASIKATLRGDKTNLVESSGAHLVQDSSHSKFEDVIQEAINKISELPVTKVILLPNKKVKYLEHGKELDFDLTYTKQDLLRLSKFYSKGKRIHTEKIDENIKCTIFNSGTNSSSLEAYIYLEKINILNKARCNADAVDAISNALTQGKDIIFAGKNKKSIHMLMSELTSNHQFATLDQFETFSINDQSIRLDASSKNELLTSGQFSKEAMIQRYLVDDVQLYDAFNAFIKEFPLGGMSYLQANSLAETQMKIANICRAEFWCDVLVWVDVEEDVSIVKSVYKAVISEKTGEIDFNQIF